MISPCACPVPCRVGPALDDALHHDRRGKPLHTGQDGELLVAQRLVGGYESDVIAAATRLAAFSPARCLIRPSLAAPRITSRDPSGDALMVTVTTAGLRFPTPAPTTPTTRSSPTASRSSRLP